MNSAYFQLKFLQLKENLQEKVWNRIVDII